MYCSAAATDSIRSSWRMMVMALSRVRGGDGSGRMLPCLPCATLAFGGGQGCARIGQTSQCTQGVTRMILTWWRRFLALESAAGIVLALAALAALLISNSPLQGKPGLMKSPLWR